MKKGNVNGRISNFERRGVDFHSASVLSRGRPMSRFTHCVRSSVSSVTLNPLGVTLAPLQSTIL
ncbi:hypothetical protein, partial [Lysinibacillus sp. F5]|uniref:hypothetical protein n=1 Tax=Lysinibacillus sp. F5 TaxID=1700846 RepID=UPI001E65C962